MARHLRPPGPHSYSPVFLHAADRVLGCEDTARHGASAAWSSGGFQPQPDSTGFEPVVIKLAGWEDLADITYSTLPGFNDSQQHKAWLTTWASTINYSINPTTFLEATLGHSRNDRAGCVQGQSNTAPTFCESGLPMNDVAGLDKSDLGNLPLIFPDAGVIDKSHYAYEALQAVNRPIWAGTRLRMVPSFAWGGRVNYAPRTSRSPAG